jgi:hypothetical protein
MIQGVVTFPTVVSGNTQKEFTFAISINQNPIDWTGVKSCIEFKGNGDKILKSFSSEDGSILHQASGVLVVPKWKCEFDPAIYTTDLKHVFPNADEKTYVKIEMEVIRGYTLKCPR